MFKLKKNYLPINSYINNEILYVKFSYTTIVLSL